MPILDTLAVLSFRAAITSFAAVITEEMEVDASPVAGMAVMAASNAFSFSLMAVYPAMMTGVSLSGPPLPNMEPNHT